MTDAMKARRVNIHDRAADGKLTPLPDLALPQPPEMDCGGHGLYATVGDYMKFIRMMLNDGAGPKGRVLKAETVDAMLANCFYWIDRKNGICGYWATQTLPFQDAVSYPGFC